MSAGPHDTRRNSLSGDPDAGRVEDVAGLSNSGSDHFLGDLVLPDHEKSMSVTRNRGKARAGRTENPVGYGEFWRER